MLDLLEPRLLLAVVVTDYEQYFLELLNRARLNPAAEAARYGVDLNEGLAPGTISTAAKQPLSMNEYLVLSAQGHSTWMIETDLFQHAGPNNNTPGDRMAGAGYQFVPPWSWAENIAYSASTAQLNYLQTAAEIHRDLFVDNGVDGRGHRVNMMNASLREAGIGISLGLFTTEGITYNAMMLTQDFAYSGSSVFLTGVAYSDAVINDDLYTPGEGFGGVLVTATRTQDNAAFQAASISTGGYSLALPAGTYTVTASGGALGNPVIYYNVSISSQNVKVDFTPQATQEQTYPAAQSFPEDSTLLLAASNNRQILLADTTGAASALRVTLTAQHGTLTLAGLNGLTFATGDGTSDQTMTFTGTVPYVNAALNGLTFQPPQDYNGSGSLEILTQAVVNQSLTTLDDHVIPITVLSVNDPPSFVKGPDQTVLEDAGLVTVPNWATAISTGPASEALQTYSFLLSTTNNALFQTLPAISTDGTLTFRPAANAYGSASVSVMMLDNGGTTYGGVNAFTQTFNITVQPVNDPPVVSVPLPQNATKAGVLIFWAAGGNAITVADPDAGSAGLRVTLTATNGTLTVGSTLNLTVTGNTTSTVTLSGTAAAINYGLNGLTFRATPGIADASLAVLAEDLGNTGAGGPLVDNRSIAITIPSNAAPVNTVPGVQTAGQEAALVFSLANGNRITVADTDAGANPIRVTLTAPDGTLLLASSLNVLVGGNGSSTLSLTGAIPAINAALNGLTFHGKAGFTGPTTLQVLSDDQGFTGSGGPQTDTDVIPVTVTVGRQFALNGRAPIRFTDASGDLVTVLLVGGSGMVYLPAGDRGDIQLIVLSNTTERSLLLISTAGRTAVGEITAGGPMGTISAAYVTLTGPLSIGPTASATAGVTIILDKLQESQVNSQMAITTFIANAWTDADGTPDVLTAPRLGTAIFRGNLEADFDLQGTANARGQNLGVLQVLGSLAGSVTLAKAGGTLIVGNWTAGTLGGTYIGSLISRGALGATINLIGQNAAGASLTLLSVSGAVTSAAITLTGSAGTIIAGSWAVPAFGALFAGSVIDRGNFTGSFHLTGQNVAGSSLALLSVAGTAQNADVRARGSIGSVQVGSSIDSTLFAGVLDSVQNQLPAQSSDFLAPLNRARPISIGLVMITKPTGQVANSFVAAPTIGTVILRNVQTASGTGPWGLAADEVIRTYIRYETGLRPMVATNIRKSLTADGNAGAWIV